MIRYGLSRSAVTVCQATVGQFGANMAPFPTKCISNSHISTCAICDHQKWFHYLRAFPILTHWCAWILHQSQPLCSPISSCRCPQKHFGHLGQRDWPIKISICRTFPSHSLAIGVSLKIWSTSQKLRSAGGIDGWILKTINHDQFSGSIDTPFPIRIRCPASSTPGPSGFDKKKYKDFSDLAPSDLGIPFFGWFWYMSIFFPMKAALVSTPLTRPSDLPGRCPQPRWCPWLSCGQCPPQDFLNRLAFREDPIILIYIYTICIYTYIDMMAYNSIDSCWSWKSSLKRWLNPHDSASSSWKSPRMWLSTWGCNWGYKWV